MRTRREQWVKRVVGWRRSGLTAREFAAKIGVKSATLSHWAWQLRREQRMRDSRWPQVLRTLKNGTRLTAIFVGATLAFHALYLIPTTRHLAGKLMEEDLVVEDVTFVALMLLATV